MEQARDGDENAEGPQLVEVPDDARELDRDVEAWRREVRWQRRRARLERLVTSLAGGSRGTAGNPHLTTRLWWPLAVAGLVAVLMFGGLLTALVPHDARQTPRATPLELAAPTPPPGRAGGLLPDVELSAETGATRARDLRPAVLVLIPAGCACDQAGQAITDLVGQAAEFGLTVDVVGASSQRALVEQLVTRAARGGADGLVDTGGQLLAAYGATQLSVVPVHADGVTEAMIKGFSAGHRLEGVLDALDEPGVRAANHVSAG